MAPPDAAPALTDARALNATTILVSWEALEAGNTNGPVVGYDIAVRGSDGDGGSSLNNTLYDPDATSVALILGGMDPSQVHYWFGINHFGIKSINK